MTEASTNTDAAIKKRKTVAFLVVLMIGFVATLFHDNPRVDKITHAAVLAFLGARIFVKEL